MASCGSFSSCALLFLGSAFSKIVEKQTEWEFPQVNYIATVRTPGTNRVANVHLMKLRRRSVSKRSLLNCYKIITPKLVSL